MKSFLLLTLLFAVATSSISSKILLQDIQVLTFRKGEWTTGRRTSPIKQLQCVGGTASDQAHQVSSVLCQNIGFDGRDVVWDCKTDLKTNLKLGKSSVSCEGYTNPDDQYILNGSCGLKYELDYVNNPTYTNSNINPHDNSHTTQPKPTVIHVGRTTTTHINHIPVQTYDLSLYDEFLSFVIMICLALFVCCMCIGTNESATYNRQMRTRASTSASSYKFTDPNIPTSTTFTTSSSMPFTSSSSMPFTSSTSSSSTSSSSTDTIRNRNGETPQHVEQTTVIHNNNVNVSPPIIPPYVPPYGGVQVLPRQIIIPQFVPPTTTTTTTTNVIVVEKNKDVTPDESTHESHTFTPTERR